MTKKRKPIPGAIRRRVTCTFNLPVSVTMVVEPDDPEDLESTPWSVVEIERAECADVSPRDVHECACDEEREHLDGLARAAENLE